MRILAVAAASELQVMTEISRMLTGHEVTALTGYVDRLKVEQALAQEQFDIVQIVGHGGRGVLEWSDGPVESEDFYSMLQTQKHLRFMILNACDSVAIGIMLHNRLHIPMIATDAPIEDGVAVRFVETFYRAYKATQGRLHDSFSRARETVLRLAPAQGLVYQLINGDMITQEKLAICMEGVADRLSEMATAIQSLDARLTEMERENVAVMKQRVSWNRMLILVMTLLLLAQLATPWLNHLFAR